MGWGVASGMTHAKSFFYWNMNKTEGESREAKRGFVVFVVFVSLSVSKAFSFSFGAQEGKDIPLKKRGEKSLCVLGSDCVMSKGKEKAQIYKSLRHIL